MFSSEVWSWCYLTLLFLLQDFVCVHTALTCRAGEKKRFNTCVPCSDNEYSEVPGNSYFCLKCDSCDQESGSEVLSACTKKSNSKCRCRTGFTQRDPQQTMCKCEKGSGLVETDSGKECHKCKHGFFTSDVNMSCKRWSECKNTGVKSIGSETSDVICNQPTPGDDNVTFTTTTTTPGQNHSILPAAQTTTSTTTTLDLSSTSNPSMTGSFGKSRLEWIICALGLMLFPLSAMSFKLLITLYLKNRKKLTIKSDSACRLPVEECGDNNGFTLVKSIQDLL